MGIRVVMLTGDNERTAQAIGAEAGVDEVIAGVLPDGKESCDPYTEGAGARVAMVGDGINDAPALTQCRYRHRDWSRYRYRDRCGRCCTDEEPIERRSGGDPLEPGDPAQHPREPVLGILFTISSAFRSRQVSGIRSLGWKLNPMFGAAAMSLSSFCVVTNALRLNLFGMYDAGKDKKRRKKGSTTGNGSRPANTGSATAVQPEENQKEKENKDMEKTMEIKGMMCGHCEARVKKALEALPEVTEAIVSHEAGTAVVKLSAAVSDDVLKKAVEDQDYEVTDIR